MRTGFLARLMGSPVLFVVLFISAFGLAAAWQKAENAKAPPAIAGYDWAQHPDTLLISVPPTDCDCGLTPSEWAKQGISHKLDVLVLSDKKQPAWSALKRLFPQRVSIFTNADAGVVKRLSLRGKTTATWVRSGRMFRQADGVPPDSFFEE